MCTILRMHLKILNLRLEAEQREALLPNNKRVLPIGDGSDVPMVQGSKGFRYML